MNRAKNLLLQQESKDFETMLSRHPENIAVCPFTEKNGEVNTAFYFTDGSGIKARMVVDCKYNFGFNIYKKVYTLISR